MNDAAWIFGAAFVVCFGALALILRRAHKDPDNDFSFSELLTDPVTGTTSASRCLAAGSFAVTSFAVVYGCFTHLSDVVFTAYVTGWVAPLVSKIFADAKPAGATIVDNSVNVDTKKEPPQ